MTSLRCFDKRRDVFTNGLNSSVEGRDILDVDPINNPLFHDWQSCHHSILQQWLVDGRENNHKWLWFRMWLFWLQVAFQSKWLFQFWPKQWWPWQFTFRGKTIFQNIFQQLLSDFATSQAESITLSGVGVGGVRALNHTKWVHEALSTSTKMRVLLDSSWFIDFHGSVAKFDVYSQSSLSQYDDDKPQSMLKILYTNERCNNTRVFMLSLSSLHLDTTKQQWGASLLPQRHPYFAIVSTHDILALQPALTTANIMSCKRKQQC